MLKLSIITINRNNAEGLRRTIESVFSQNNSNFEYIIIDGVSTDDSVEVIRKYENMHNSSNMQFSLSWISEADTGIYNAMNKGIQRSKGEYILMLNSGDYLAETDVVERILPELHSDDIIQGGMYLYQKNEENLDYGNGLTEMSFFDVVGGDFLHQADFVHKNVYDRYGLYDESYRIAGDTVFFLKVLGFHDVSFRCVQIPISVFEGGGIASGTDEKWKAIQSKEMQRIEVDILGPRLSRLYREDYKKVLLYNTLREHKWSWLLVMLIVRVVKFIYRKK